MPSISKTMKWYLMHQKQKVLFFLKMKTSNRFSVKGADLAKSVDELHNIDGAKHLDFHIYISGLCFYESA